VTVAATVTAAVTVAATVTAAVTVAVPLVTMSFTTGEFGMSYDVATGATTVVTASTDHAAATAMPAAVTEATAIAADLPTPPTRRSSPAVPWTIVIPAFVPTRAVPPLTGKAISFAAQVILNVVDDVDLVERCAHAGQITNWHRIRWIGRRPCNHQRRRTRDNR
jgi:hypothetical protein